MSQVNIMESAKVSSSHNLSIKIMDIDINLVGKSQDYKQKLLNETVQVLRKKRSDLSYLSKLIANERDVQKLKELENKSRSISKAILRIETEIETILEASIVDKQNLYTPRNFSLEEKSTFSPIGRKNDEQIKESNIDIINRIIKEDMETFEIKMYEILGNGDSEVIVPVLKKLAETHGHRLSKIPTKK